MKQLQQDLAAAQSALREARREADARETLARDAEAELEAMRQHLDAVVEERDSTLKSIAAAIEQDREKAVNKIKGLEEQVVMLSTAGGTEITGQAMSQQTSGERLQRFKERMLLRTVFCVFKDWRGATTFSLHLLKVSWLEEEIAEKSALLQGAVYVTNSLARDVQALQDHVVAVVTKARQALSIG